MTHDLATPQDLRSAYGRYCRLLDLAEEQFAASRPKAAVALAQVAARLAFPANVGLFASPRLEALLVKIGQAQAVAQSASHPLAADQSAAPDAGSGSGRLRLLHVLSYARPVGGDTRFVWRWIQEDPDSIHSVAVTSQAELADSTEVPQPLQAAVKRTGGMLTLLRASPAQPLAQAEELRQLCAAADLVVLHLFPYDVIPVIALASLHGGPKVLYIHHSDHTFWIGGRVSHEVVHVRAQQPAFLAQRRHLRPGIGSILPIPLAYRAPSMSRKQAKFVLGVSEETVVLLTIASAFKYAAPGRVGLLELVMPLLMAQPNVILMAVGPVPEGPWAAAVQASGGRVMALGTQHDNEARYCAADIYLDSVPFSSVTSILEAGTHGAALLGYAPPSPDLHTLGPGAPGLEDTMLLADSPEAYRALLQRLVVDGAFRQEQGALARARILDRHTGPGWSRALSDLYTALPGLTNGHCLTASQDAFEVSELNLALIHLYQKVQSPRALSQLVRHFLKPLDFSVRARLVWRLYRKGLGAHPASLAPSATHAAARQLLQLVRQLRTRWASQDAPGGKSSPSHV